MATDQFCVTAIDGDAVDFGADAMMPWLRFNNLSWDEVAEVARFCFREGYQLIAWKLDNGENTVIGDDGTA